MRHNKFNTSKEGINLFVLSKLEKWTLLFCLTVSINQVIFYANKHAI